MNRFATISRSTIRHNQRPQGGDGRVSDKDTGCVPLLLSSEDRRHCSRAVAHTRKRGLVLPLTRCPRLRFGLVVLVATVPWPGCASAPIAPAPVPSWELANAEPFEPVLLGRARVSFDRPLPAHLTQELSREFSLVMIRDRSAWADVRRRLQLPPAPPGIDLDEGMIVGILAKVGQNAEGRWPIHLRSIRRCGQEGSIEATFTPGLYYPVLTAGYVEFAFAPGLRRLSMVRINQRKFLIRSRSGLH